MYLTRNQAYVQTYRGFESHPLRQDANPRARNHSGVFAFCRFLVLLHGLATCSLNLPIFMPRLAPYLQRRGSGFTFRISVPPELRQLIGAREFTKALSETNHEAASPTALEFAAAAKRLFCEVRAMTGREINHDKLQLVVAKLQRKLDRESAEESAQAVEREHALALQRLEREKKEAVRVARLEAENVALLKALEVQQRPIHVEVAQPALPAASALLSAAPMASPADYAAAINAAVVKVASPAPAPLKPAPTLKGVVDAFLAQYEKHAEVTKDGREMLKKHQKALPLLVELIGDKPVNELQQADINGYFAVVNALPPYWSDKCERRNLSVRELAALEHDATIAPKTFRESYVGCVRPFLEAAQRDYGDQGFPLTLTTKGIKYLGDVDEGESKQRAFKHHELQRLFAGAELQAFAADPKQHAKYWLPTLGLFTGARVNELCQLNPQVDILQEPETGIWYLWITTESEADSGIEKSVKTGESRKVPLHKKLIELGFLNYVSRIKASGAKRLFPVWKPAPDRKASPAAEKWFVRLIRKTGLRDETPKAQLVGMHSFRHTLLSYGVASKPSLNLGPITGHRQIAPGVSAVQAGYIDESITDKLEDGQALLNQLDYGLEFFKPSMHA